MRHRGAASACGASTPVRPASWPATSISWRTCPRPGDAWLSILAIRPRFRRSGVGTAVIVRLKRELAAGGFRFALARVYLANVPALRFWMRQGFTEVVPHRGNYVGSDLGKPCIVLRAALGR